MPRLHALSFLFAALALMASDAAAGPRAPQRKPMIVLSSATSGERTVEAADLAFAYYRRIMYTRRAPRAEEPTGRRHEVEDRRKECRCLRFQDWSKKRFRRLRQIEISYPPGAYAARVRITEQDGDVREFPATELFGSEGVSPPRLVATVDGARREYALVRAGDAGASWPEEMPIRILLVGSIAPRRR